MGRPRIYDEPRVATAIRLPVSLRDELQASALQRGVSVNVLVTRALLEFLARPPDISLEEARGERSRSRRAFVSATS